MEICVCFINSDAVVRGAQKERKTEMYARELRRIWQAVPAILLVALLLGNMVGLAEGEEQEICLGIWHKISDHRF